MGRRGPRPTPTALQIARGNPGKRALNEDEPELESASTDPPADLKGRAREEWERLAADLVTSGVLTVGDLSAFETYCRLVGEEAEYQRLVNKVGREDAHRLGYASYLLKLRGQKKQYAAELGLTPSSRSGVKAKKPQEKTDERRRRFFGVHDGGAARQA